MDALLGTVFSDDQLVLMMANEKRVTLSFLEIYGFALIGNMCAVCSVPSLPIIVWHKMSGWTTTTIYQKGVVNVY